MTHLRQSAVALGMVVLVAAVAYGLFGRRASIAQQETPQAQSAKQDGKLPARPQTSNTAAKQEQRRDSQAVASAAVRFESVQAAIMNSPSLVQAIADARTKYGQSKTISYAEMSIRMICSIDADLTGAVDSGDTSRLWAVSQVRQQCADIEKLPEGNVPVSFDSPAKAEKEYGAEAGVKASLQVIRTSDEAPELIEAGQVLIESNQVTSSSIPGIDANLGQVELTKAWIYASTLWSCDQNGGCGPENFQTAAFCANAGCPAGSTLWNGMRAAIPAREMQAVEVFYRWIKNNR
jgi:hypothetical protein